MVEEESHEHLFCRCSFSTAVLRGVLRSFQLQPREFTMEYLKEWLIKVGKGRSLRARMIRRRFAAALYEVWMERNSQIFRNVYADTEGIIRKALNF
ncbi:hypothetical protein Dimus_004450 [Dionaea muscipula]